MAAKELTYGAKAREKMLRGVDILAGLLMTTEAMVAEKPKKEKSSAPAMPPEDMY